MGCHLAFPRERRLGTKLAGNEGAIVLSHEQELWLNPQLVQSARCTGSRHRLYSCRPVDEFLQKLNPVSKGIRGVEAARPRNRIIPDDLVTGLDKAVAKAVDLFNDEGRVGPSLGLELHIDPDMDLALTSTKPAPAATLKHGWLLLLEHTKNADEERASFGLFTWRHRELDVIDDHPRGPHGTR